MTDDATLSEFASSSENGRDGTEVDGKVSGETAAATDEPVPTYAWGEYACADCGERTERVWYRDGEPTCPACADWS